MKRLGYKPRVIACCLAALLIDIAGCKDNSVSGKMGKTSDPIVINTIDPAQGPYDTEVTIKGKNFPADSALLVTFNGVEAEVLNATGTQITAKVPKKAGVGPVRVISPEDTARSVDFKYELTTTVTTIAGTGEAGDVDGPRDQAQFNNPIGITGLTNADLLVADFYNDKIRRISPQGKVETIIEGGVDADGNFDGRFTDVTVSPDEDYLLMAAGSRQVVYISDQYQDPGFSGYYGVRGRKGYQDGGAFKAKFNDPWATVISPDGARIYVSDRLNNCIRLIDSKIHVVTTFAGTDSKGFKDGLGVSARFYSPNGMDIDAEGNLYIADRNNHSIRKVTPEGEVSTIAGDGTPVLKDGPADQASFKKPRGVALDKEGNIYVADFGNNSIRKITPEGQVSTIINGLNNAGFTDGASVENHPSGLPQAQIEGPNDLYVDVKGVIYFTDQGNHAVRKITIE